MPPCDKPWLHSGAKPSLWHNDDTRCQPKRRASEKGLYNRKPFLTSVVLSSPSYSNVLVPWTIITRYSVHCVLYQG